MDKNYQHLNHEKKIYQLWEQTNSFAPRANPQQPTFSIIMPPPNANDPLHIGHALFVSLEDILIRFHRMLGEETVWIPGTDHAGIETQYVFEKKLAKQGKSRFDFDRDTLYQQIWQYVQENSGVAIDQMKQLGASADWQRYKFTLSEEVVSFVKETFQKLFNEKLIYRDLRLVNYCPKCGTSYSELEVNHLEQPAKLYYLKYGPFELATTRPETKFGDTAVAVHPQDTRYQQYIGQEIEVEGLLGNFKIKVVADEYVDPKFGTGVVKITPYHDFNDYEVWQRHKDEMPAPKQVIGYDGRLNEHAGKYAGLKVKIAREQIVQDLAAKGLLVKTKEDYVNTVGTCYRCGSIIEPLPLPQFFLKVKDENKEKSLVDQVLAALDKKETKIYGPGREKILRHWLSNLKDWNISRQIVWGIQIPVWYSVSDNPSLEVVFLDKNKTTVRMNIVEALKRYSFADIESQLQRVIAPENANFVVSTTRPQGEYLQETDTFDTWFSSAQWPVVTLKTGQIGDFDRFYPTSVMETGYDILPFWVMRMMMMGYFLTGQMPFQQVYLHGLVRDEKGQKMSKSKGNVINPLSLSEKYGADALRMALVMSTTAGNDSAIGETKVKGMRNFSNKIWNATRFIVLASETQQLDKEVNTEKQHDFEQRLSQVQQHVTQQLQTLKIGLAAETVHNEFWHWFCDECIEAAKKGELSYRSLFQGLLVFLKLLHPFMPFVTETIWQTLKDHPHFTPFFKSEAQMLISSTWPAK